MTVTELTGRNPNEDCYAGARPFSARVAAGENFRTVKRHPPAREPRRAVRLEIDWLHVTVVNANRRVRSPWPDHSTHKTPAIKKWLLAHPRFVLHFTPTSSSWLNLVERWFSELTNKKLRRGAHRSVRELNTDIRAWITDWNENPRPYVWTKTTDQILDSISRYYDRIKASRH